MPLSGKRNSVRRTEPPGSEAVAARDIAVDPTLAPAFGEVAGMIREARAAAHRVVDTGLIDLYWRVGAYISQKAESAA